MLKKYPDLVLAVLFALVTGLFVPFSIPRMAGSINWGLLGLLFCLMAIVAGLRKRGVLEKGLFLVFHGSVSVRKLCRFFIFACFFASMLMTNDVSLIVFVPMALRTFSRLHLTGLMISVVVLQTIAANLGSMLTPVGSPQNLFLYSFYHMGLLPFLSITAPVVLLAGLLLWGATFLFPVQKVELPAAGRNEKPDRLRPGTLWLWVLFCLCLLHVLRLLPLTWLLLVVVPSLFLLDRTLFRDVDYKLLLLFLFLFVGVGNLNALPAVRSGAVALLSGHEFWVSLLLSQVISNVPATVMLAPYTEAVRPLLLGVNIGGLGTLIASMASLISFKAYAGTEGTERKRYLGFFTAYNLAFLLVLAAFVVLGEGL